MENQFKVLLFQVAGREKEEEEGDSESAILVLLRRSLEDSEKSWQRHLLVALVPAWLAIMAYAIWALANI